MNVGPFDVNDIEEGRQAAVIRIITYARTLMQI